MELKEKTFAGKKIAVLGLGIEGLSTVRFFTKHEAKITVFDQREEQDISDDVLRELNDLGVDIVLGKDAFAKIEKFDLAVRSPGLHKDSEGVKKAEKEGAIITSQTKLFFDLCPAQIIGVTGTKGKGTTSSLIYEMLKAEGRDAYLGGNIGTPPFEFLDKLTDTSWVVLELSSFQLHDLHKSPHIAVMLMVVPEHLNYHEDVSDYIDAKRNILRYQSSSDYAVLNRDYIATNESDIYTDGQVFYVTRERSSTEQGAFIKDGAIWMSMKGQEWKIIDTDRIALPGKHNWENAAAASVAATLAGVSKAEIVKVLTSFTGLEHRLELVREVGGVKYYDDSFSTTPETAIAAIQSFQSPEVLILGGASKNSDFTELGDIISKADNIKAIIGIGEEWERIKKEILSHYSSSEANAESRSGEEDGSRPVSQQGGQARTIPPVMVEGAKDMKTIVVAASKIAQPGDVVLLSPACTSFDMFKDYKERGELFKAEVNKL